MAAAACSLAPTLVRVAQDRANATLKRIMTPLLFF
jgi:hypothetical protein